jgi:acyl-CoA reductase-like NAD-dependent aldehyde dehydrogenase
MVWVNTHTESSASFPFGGTKWSAVGVQGGRWAIDGGTDIQLIFKKKTRTS